MFGIDFARPKESLKLKMAWDMLHKLNFGVFGQMIIIPLLQKHRPNPIEFSGGKPVIHT